jgi:hypothetical protein
MFPVLALSLSAPVGATILGIVAISQIRRSNGALYGLPLAVTDALFFPLILLDAVLVALIAGTFLAMAGAFTKHSPDPAVAVPVTVIALAVAVVADVWIVKRTLRAARVDA